jgi:hypothetical protein
MKPPGRNEERGKRIEVGEEDRGKKDTRGRADEDRDEAIRAVTSFL